MIFSPLLENLTGRVIAPGDPDYDAARTVFYGNVDRRPALIVKVADAADVSTVLAMARETGMELAVRSGGHSVAGHGVAEGGIVLDVSELRDLEIDTEARTAWAGTGLTAGEYSIAAARYGLATGFGDAATVGIGGITLSGGVGFLLRKRGMTIDSLLGAEIVTADGVLLRVDDESHPDLFWAIRGGGGNFGVATRLKFRLHELDSFVGGSLILPATPAVIESFIAAAEAAPDELSTIANVMPAPPLPFLAPELHGRLVLFATLAYAGDVEEGNRVLEPFRALAPPLADVVKPVPYVEMFPPEQEGFHPAAVVRTMLLDGVDGPMAEAIVAAVEAGTGMMNVVQLRVLGGAMSRVAPDATAFAHRGSAIMANVVGMYADPAGRPEQEAWVNGLAAQMAPADGGAYAGFLGDEGEERVRAAYPGTTWERLAQVKARYDPDNLFRLNQNIPPG